MIQIGRTTIGLASPAAMISHRQLTETEYKKLSDDELKFLLGLTGTDSDLTLKELREELELIFEPENKHIFKPQETSKSQQIKKQIDSLQAEYKQEVNNNKKMVKK